MTTKADIDRLFPTLRQEGGTHYQKHKIQPYTFITANNLSFFQGNVIKYVIRYKDKNGIEDLKKIIHYCELEIEEMRKEGNQLYQGLSESGVVNSNVTMGDLSKLLKEKK